MTTPDEPREEGRRRRPNVFGQHLQKRRGDLGLGLRELARRVGVSSGFLSMLESGERMRPTPELAAKLAEELRDNPAIYKVWASMPDVSNLRMGPISSKSLAAAEAATETAFGELHRLMQDPDVRTLMVGPEEAKLSSRWSDMRGTKHAFPPQDAVEAPARRLSSFNEIDTTSSGMESGAIPILPEGFDPGDGAIPGRHVLDSVTLNLGEHGPRLVRPFAYRVSEQAIFRVTDKLRVGDLVVISRETDPLLPEEVYAVRFRGKVVLSRIVRKEDSLLLLPPRDASRDDRNLERHIEVLPLTPSEGPPPVVGMVAVAMRYFWAGGDDPGHPTS